LKASSEISRTEWLVLILLALSIITGYILYYVDVDLFFKQVQVGNAYIETGYTAEDRIVEWVTVLGLLLASFTCFKRAFGLFRLKSPVFIVVAFLMGLVLFFGAGEEISWGQRILGIRAPEYFQQNNTQGETNFHNLVLGGIKVNLWIFSFFLSFVLAIYVFLIPWLYRKKQWMRNFVDYIGIPLPRVYQMIAFILLFIATQLFPHEKRAELLELGTALLLFLIIRYPANTTTFNKESFRSIH
jgi:hypothetical protein